MEKKIYPLVLMLALSGLTGCGLKGPLYFPPTDNSPPQHQQKSTTVQEKRGGQHQAPTLPANISLE